MGFPKLSSSTHENLVEIQSNRTDMVSYLCWNVQASKPEKGLAGFTDSLARALENPVQPLLDEREKLNI